jgi:hypothetical protein
MVKKIGNYPASHPLAKYRCKQIADSVKFIIEYENEHKVKLDRERGDLKLFFWAFTCDTPDAPGYDAVKYSERYHRHSPAARRVITEAKTRSRRKIKGLRHEHVVPLSVLRDMLFNDTRVRLGDPNAVSRILEENLHSAVITRDEALYIDRSYRTTMPEGWQPGTDPYMRYNKMNVKLLDPELD